jgi:hypothetical protein
MRYRLATLAVALVLAGTGLWLATIHASSYMRIMNTDDNARRVVQVNGNGIPELHFCDDAMCVPYGEIRQQYMGYFAVDALIFAASMGLVTVLYVWRRRTQAKSIV